MTDFEELDGVGPARSDSIVDAGYESMDELANADHDSLAEEIGVPEDTALEFVVQAQNVVEDDEDASADAEDDSDEADPLPADLAEPDESGAADSEEDDTDESDEYYELVVDLDTDLHYDVYMDALLNAYERRYGSHQPKIDATAKVLDDARYNSGEVSHELTEYELNNLHAAVTQQEKDYKGNNMIDHMDAMLDIVDQVNEVRNEKLF